MTYETRELIVIGGGPAGYTAALYAARATLEPLVIEGFAWGGQLMITSDVENYPGYADGILGPQMMQDFRRQAERFGAEFLTDDVTRVDFTEHPFRVWVGDNEYRAESVIVSTGASARQLGLETERTLQGKGVSYCAVCDAAFFKDKDVVVVGGGDSAMEEAIFLTKFASKVTLIHRRDEFRASPIMVDRARANEKVEFVTPTVVEEVLAEDGQTTGCTLAGRRCTTRSRARSTGARSGCCSSRRSTTTSLARASRGTTTTCSAPSWCRSASARRIASSTRRSTSSRRARSSSPSSRPRSAATRSTRPPHKNRCASRTSLGPARCSTASST